MYLTNDGTGLNLNSPTVQMMLAASPQMASSNIPVCYSQGPTLEHTEVDPRTGEIVKQETYQLPPAASNPGFYNQMINQNINNRLQTNGFYQPQLAGTQYPAVNFGNLPGMPPTIQNFNQPQQQQGPDMSNYGWRLMRGWERHHGGMLNSPLFSGYGFNPYFNQQQAQQYGVPTNQDGSPRDFVKEERIRQFGTDYEKARLQAANQNNLSYDDQFAMEARFYKQMSLVASTANGLDEEQAQQKAAKYDPPKANPEDNNEPNIPFHERWRRYHEDRVLPPFTVSLMQGDKVIYTNKDKPFRKNYATFFREHPDAQYVDYYRAQMQVRQAAIINRNNYLYDTAIERKIDRECNPKDFMDLMNNHMYLVELDKLDKKLQEQRNNFRVGNFSKNQYIGQINRDRQKFTEFSMQSVANGHDDTIDRRFKQELDCNPDILASIKRTEEELKKNRVYVEEEDPYADIEITPDGTPYANNVMAAEGPSVTITPEGKFIQGRNGIMPDGRKLPPDVDPTVAEAFTRDPNGKIHVRIPDSFAQRITERKNFMNEVAMYEQLGRRASELQASNQMKEIYEQTKFKETSDGHRGLIEEVPPK